jgi:hypothetical protein
MDISNIFRMIRKSPLGLVIRAKISTWLGYQQVPKPNSMDPMKAKIREILSLVSTSATLNRDEKKKIKSTRNLRNSRNNLALLIGNGPSAKTLTVSQVEQLRSQGASIAVMNNYFRSDISKEVIPDYYFIADPNYWDPKFIGTTEDAERLREYLCKHHDRITVVQPVLFPPLVEAKSIIYLDGRSCKGLLRIARPDKPWGLPAAVALYSISTLKFLGHRDIFFLGLDSNFINFFFVDGLNRVVNRRQGQHFYKDDEDIADNLEPLESETNRPLPFRHLADLYYAHGIFLRDLYWLTKDNCINVGNDQSNDSAPRACLLPRSDLDS